MKKFLSIMLIMFLATTITAISSEVLPPASIQERVQEQLKNDGLQELDLDGEAYETKVTTCERKIERYEEKFEKYLAIPNPNKYELWKLEYYAKRLEWWEEYCEEIE
jgi:hypothetical protein